MKKLLLIVFSAAVTFCSCSKNSADDLSATVQAASQPVSSNFSLPADEAKEGTAVSFKNNSINAVSYKWDFGNGTTSTEKEPSFTYNICGVYNVKLTATDAKGNVAETMQSLVVNCIFTSVPGAHPTHPALF